MEGDVGVVGGADFRRKHVDGKQYITRRDDAGGSGFAHFTMAV